MKTRANAFLSCFLTLMSFLVFLSDMNTSAYAESFDVSAGFAIAAPQGDHADFIDRNAYGVSIEGLYKPTSFPFSIGAEVTFMNYGSEERTEPLSSTIPDLRVRVENDNNFVSGNFLMRIRPYEGAVSPYFDALVGFKYIFTSTEIVSNQEVIATDTNFDDITGEYGIGAGVNIRLFTFEKPVGGTLPATLFLDFKARYIKGGEAEYLKEGSIIRSGTEVEYETYQSETDMLMYVIGLNLRF